MDVTFEFLTVTGRFTAALPDGLTFTQEKSSSVVLNGTPRAVVFRAERNDPLRGQQILDGDAGARSSATVTQQRGDAGIRFVRWPVAGGDVSTHVDMDANGEAGVRVILQNVAVNETPLKVSYAGPLSHGDLRTNEERDHVLFYAPDDAVPTSVDFAYAGGFAKDADIAWGDVAIVRRATEHGIVVACDGAMGHQAEVRAVARAVAASLRQVA